MCLAKRDFINTSLYTLLMDFYTTRPFKILCCKACSFFWSVFYNSPSCSKVAAWVFSGYSRFTCVMGLIITEGGVGVGVLILGETLNIPLKHFD